ncbi:hypothetical protein DWB85_00220 [Seongchinamella sediminis]|uniref:Homing endonuclease LAGLIDADG domain-containing protein n=2 Tax=Seongchinamella sediminis TaxID=2283635 RepID=A0A3L7E3W5_9GAMM|nr:hypothetical protein DWB85_00220 [Seongchinamella sediminis]
MRYRVAKKLTTAEAAYIAGLVDGEGSVTLTRKHQNENRHLGLTISSTELQLLQFVVDASGVGNISNKQASKPNHSHSFAYGVYNRQALQVVEQIYPHLLSYKADRCALVLRDYLRLTPRNGKYTSELTKERMQFESQFLSIRP